MKMRTILPFLSVTLLPAYAATEAETEQLYVRAIAAVDRGDCAAGAILLRDYKVAASATLTAKPNFAAAIDRQIASCEHVVVTEPKRSIFTGKGRAIPDARGLDQLQQSQGVLRK